MKALLLATLLVSSMVQNGPGTQWPGLRVDTVTYDVPTTFVIKGGLLQYDVVHIWAFPPNVDPVFLGAAFADQPDVPTQRPFGGWSLIAHAPVGRYPIVVYAHDPETGTFPVQLVRYYNVRPCFLGGWIWTYWIVPPNSGTGFKQFYACF